MRKFTPKPCPGCGAVVELAPNSVCSGCATAIREYPQARAALESSNTEKLREFLLGERTGIPSVIYRYQSAPAFASAMSALLRCVGHATEYAGPKGSSNPRRVSCSNYGILECEHRDIECQDWQIHLPQDVGTPLAGLFRAVSEVVAEAEAKGQAKGQNLLFQLNSGALSVNDFNEAATKVRGS